MANPKKNVDYMATAIDQYERLRRERARLQEQPIVPLAVRLHEQACRAVAIVANTNAWSASQRCSARGMLRELFFGHNTTTVAIVMQSGHEAHPVVAEVVEEVFDNVTRQNSDELHRVNLPGVTWMHSSSAMRAASA